MSEEKPKFPNIECPKSVRWESPKKSWEPPKTEVKTRYEAVDRFLEDLGRVKDVCQSPAIHPEYEKLRRFVCDGDIDAVVDAPWDRTIAFATYYLMFHKRDLETARKALELLETRDLDDEEEAMLKILELAYKAAANPPCNDPEMLRRYVKRVRSAPEPTERVKLLKTLILMHLTDDLKNVDAFKNKIKRAFEERKNIVHECDNVYCTKRVEYHPLPFHHFAFYIADKVKSLCSARQPESVQKSPETAQKSVSLSTFEECLDSWKNFRKVFEAALVPVATAVTALFLHKLVVPFALLSMFYVLWTFHMYKKYVNKKEVPVCISDVWKSTGWMVAIGNIVAVLAFSYVFATVSSGERNLTNLILVVSAFAGMLFAWLNMFIISALAMPGKPRGVYFPKTGTWDEHSEYKRFFEDLVDTWNMQSMCSGWLPHEHYNKLKALICRDDIEAAEKVSESWPLILMAYYLMFHRRNLETAQKVLSLLKSRNLDEKEKAVLEILETAGEVAAKPPCGNPETLRLYAKKISGIQTYGWASLLKALVMTHLTCDPDYKDDVKLAILWTVERCDCDNLSICYFAYRLLNRIKPLCSCFV